MSHELTIKAGRAEMAYVGAVPWHGLGQQLTAGASMAEWLAAAGMAWKIQRAKVRYATGHGQGAEAWRTIDDRHVLLRSDTGEALGIVSDGYKVVQPGEVLQFFEDLCEAQGFAMETAGTLFGGKRFWALASVGKEAVIRDPRDKVKAHILLSTSADGTLATTGRYVNTRVVCNNTIQAAFAEAGGAVVTMKHKTVFSAQDMKQKLGIGPEFESFIERMRRLADTAMSESRMLQETVRLLKPGVWETQDKEQIDSAVRSKPVTRVLELAIDGNGSLGGDFDGVRGTAWGWLNAATQYVDHEARAHNVDNRLNSAWFGKGDEMKTRALEQATAYATQTDTRTVATVTGSDLLGGLLAKPIRHG